MIAQVGGTARLQRQDGHERDHLAARFAQRIAKPSTAEHASNCIREQSHLYAFARSLGQQLNQTPADLVSPKYKRNNMDGVTRFAALFLELGVGLFAIDKKTHRISAHGRTHPVERKRASSRTGCGRGGWHAGKNRAKSVFAFNEAAEFAPAENKIKRHTHVRHQSHSQQPRDGVTRLTLFTHESRDQKKRDKKSADGE